MKLNKRLILISAAIGIGVILIVMFVVSSFKISPGLEKVSGIKRDIPSNTARAEIKTITEWYEAVGTVRPHTEIRIEAQVTAQVTDVKVNHGDKVEKNQLLVVLDSRQFLSRLDQAREGLKIANAAKKKASQAKISAQAAMSEAASAYKRTKTYFESQAATAQDLEQSESAFLQAQAGLNQAEESLTATAAGIRHAEEVIKEAEFALEYTKIKAPETGEVLKRLVEPGDLALPGKPLVILQASGALRLEANVREGMISQIGPGTKLQASIDPQDDNIDVTVEEIVPYADPETRTFIVKVSLPMDIGLYPGMYGKLLIPVEEVRIVAIPQSAVKQIGQLELVSVKVDEIWTIRYIKTGKKIDGLVEVLSGLSGNEIIGLEG
ncbi:MAG: efflux RND transporter periplasmic adaptor subunit [Desulfobacterales bacterium]|nr:efflux RND transporter periplasmic adaptor subunit [Desulfobacterales bacterium]